MESRDRPPTDYRRTRKRNELSLLIVAIVVLVVVGGGLIGVIFGLSQLLTAVPCLLAGAGLIAVLYFFFAIMERWSEG
jgi:protein-S-isoprenylcysteine O-methyltransferase Ste14